MIPATRLRKFLAAKRFLRGKPVRVRFGICRWNGRAARTTREAQEIARRNAV